MESKDLIIVKQLPIIEEKLKVLNEQIVANTQSALSLAVTEDSLKVVKETRASLNKTREEMETRRKEVKAAINEPYDKFNKLYTELILNPLVTADKQLKEDIEKVESKLVEDITVKIKTYYDEYAQSVSCQLVPFEKSGIKINRSASETSLRKKCSEFIDKVAGDIYLMASNEDTYNEVLIEYLGNGCNLANATQIVTNRLKAVAELQQKDVVAKVVEVQEETIQEVAENEAESIQATEDDDVYEVSFSVSGTIQKIKALKAFLNDNAYEYTQL